MQTQIPGHAAAVGLLAPADAPEAKKILTLAASELARFGLSGDVRIVHSPEEAAAYAGGAEGRNVRALIVGSADTGLPSALAALTPLPVIRVPVAETAGTRRLALLWPEPEAADGPPVNAFATVAVGEAGARNAVLFVVSVLALTDGSLRHRWRKFRESQKQSVLASTLPPA